MSQSGGNPYFWLCSWVYLWAWEGSCESGSTVAVSIWALSGWSHSVSLHRSSWCLHSALITQTLSHRPALVHGLLGTKPPGASWSFIYITAIPQGSPYGPELRLPSDQGWYQILMWARTLLYTTHGRVLGCAFLMRILIPDNLRWSWDCDVSTMEQLQMQMTIRGEVLLHRDTINQLLADSDQNLSTKWQLSYI